MDEPNPQYVIGIDFGTESARAVLADVKSGEIIASAAHSYSHGVIDQALPGSLNPLPPDWALQAPQDWLDALEHTVPAILSAGRVVPQQVIGIGIDFTACTVLPTTAEGTPLCSLDEYKDRPHAWAKLWKMHAAQRQAERINEMAAARHEPWLARYGGKISSEWLMPKALHMLEEDPKMYSAAALIVEGADWVAWQLTGSLVRNACAAGYKGTWHKTDGFPSAGFLVDLHPFLGDLYTSKLAGPVVPPGARVGGLSPAWAEKLGLFPGLPVAAPIIDAHSAMLGAGVGVASVMFMIMGTSTCQLLVGTKEVLVEGIAGVVEDGIIPGLFGYEAGQAGVGDIFAWFVKNAVPPAYHQAAEDAGISLHEYLSEKASDYRPGSTGLLALDWWNGNRSTLVDAELSGLLVGCTLATKPEEIYRALVEATAFGSRTIIDAFTGSGVPVDSLVVGGGLTKNEFLLQVYADVLGRKIAVVEAEQVSALGAAILGTVGAGKAGGGYDSVPQAISAMASSPARIYEPIPSHQEIYEVLFKEYRRLYDTFGRHGNDVMRVLRKMRG